MAEWFKMYEKAPPLNEDVELKVIIDGKERIYINKLIPMMDGIYKWAYCDYHPGDEVIEWREIEKIKFPCQFLEEYIYGRMKWDDMIESTCDEVDRLITEWRERYGYDIEELD